MRMRILREAASEWREAVARYEEIEPGLGVRFKNEIRSILEWIKENPELARLRPGGYRRVNSKVFPYYVAYMVWNDTLWVLAVAHGARRPEYWIERKPGGA